MSSAPVDHLIALLGRGPLAVLSGAGLSTASGIPAYRDRHGQWRHSPPIRHQEFIASDAVRRRYWARSYAGWPTLDRAQPNRGHYALAALQAAGWVSTLITQNVDGLHLRAGSATTIELHGAIRSVLCLSCLARHERRAVQDWIAAANPRLGPDTVRNAMAAPDGDAHVEPEGLAQFAVPCCPECQGTLKPDVVFFGDNVPRDRYAAAARVVEEAAALLVVASSLTVYSGYRFAEQAHRLGKPVVAINEGTTRADHLLSFKIEDDCGKVLEQLREGLQA